MNPGSTRELLDVLRRKDINIRVDGDQLRLDAPEGVLTPELREQVRERKQEVLAFLRQAQQEKATPVDAPLVRASRDEPIPLSFGQQRLWFLQQMEPRSTAYNLQSRLTLAGERDLKRIRDVLDALVLRHEIFRTTYDMVHGKLSQVIHPSVAWNATEVDLTGRSTDDVDAELARYARAEVLKPFDLSSGPVLRAVLFQLPENRVSVIITIHHIATDGWSLARMTQGFRALYRAHAAGSLDEVPLPRLQYADYAVWQRDRMQGDVLERQLDYWRRQLAGAPAQLPFPTDRPRPAVQTFNGAALTFALGEELSDGLRQLSRQAQVTQFVALLAAFKILLARYTGQDDIVVGTSNGNRSRLEFEDMLGFFVNTQVLRTELSGNPSFFDLLSRVRQVVIEAMANQDVPFEKLVEELQPQRDLSHAPLFQIAFVMQNTPMEALTRAVKRKTEFLLGGGSAKFDLTLYVVETGIGFQGSIEYNTDLFDHETIETMLGRLEHILRTVVDSPTTGIDDISMMAEEERHRLVVAFNDTHADYPDGECLHQIFEAQATRTPDAVAVRFQGRELSYSELNKRANRLAHHLRTMGVGPDALVAMCVHPALEMVVGLLGILKAGGAFVPMDPSNPEARLRFILQDSAAAVLLTQTGLRDTFADSGAHVVCLDEPIAPVTDGAEHNPKNQTTPDNLAYVIYTSGSTGTPKGTLMPHRGPVNYLSWASRTYGLESGVGAPVHSSISFDLTITAIFAPLFTGRTVDLLPADKGIEELSTALSSGRTYSFVKVTPAHLVLLGRQLTSENAGRCSRAIVIGGENLLGEQVAFWRENAPEVALFNEYGPTEAAVACCAYRVKSSDRFRSAVPIGRPIANARLFVLDRRGKPVPIGIPGELHIGGVCLARGYLNRPELTAARFIRDPFSDDPGARLYKTGDLVKFLPSGELEFLRRLDDQVKIRGFRVELGEIESILLECEGVREVACVVRGDGPHDQRLVAYLVAENRGSDLEQLCRATLSDRLPAYMVPSIFVFMDALPLASSGKVDRRALPAPDTARTDLHAQYAPPRDRIEEVVVSIWREVLGAEKIGIHDNFFDHGGHSLLLAQVHQRLQEEIDHDLTMVEMFQFPTPDALARRIGRRDGEPSASEQTTDRAERRKRAMRRQRKITAASRKRL